MAPLSLTRRRPSLLTTTTLLLLFLHLITPTTGANPQCDCFLISGPSPGYFQHHLFTDFRSLHSFLPSPDTSTTITTTNETSTDPSIIPSSATSGTEPATNDYFSTPAFADYWSINNATGLYNWSDGGTVPMVASLGNVFLTPPPANMSGSNENNTHLTLRTTRNSVFQSVAELDSLETDMEYLSLRVRARVIPVDDGAGQGSSVDEGAVAGVFSYHSDSQESDFEVLTREDSGSVRVSNQPDGDVEGASLAVRLPEGVKWTEWAEWRLDWFKGQSRWWVGGMEVGNMTVNVPRVGSWVVVNLWGDGGSWSGEMAVGGEVRLGVEWVEVVYNVSGEGVKGRCGVGCEVDGVKDVGMPEVGFNSTVEGAGTRLGVNNWLGMGVLGVVAVVAM